jgi:hypothetical protein
MMEAENTLEMSDCSILTWLATQEDFIAYSPRESLKSYMSDILKGMDTTTDIILA